MLLGPWSRCTRGPGGRSGSPGRAEPPSSSGPLGRHRFSGGSRQRSLALIYPAFHFYCVSSSPSLPPSTLWCVCPLLSAAPDKQTAAFAWRRRHLLPLRKAGGSALIPLALGSSSSLLHAPPHLKNIVPKNIDPPPTALFSPPFQLHLLLLLLFFIPLPP